MPKIDLDALLNPKPVQGGELVPVNNPNTSLDTSSNSRSVEAVGANAALSPAEAASAPAGVGGVAVLERPRVQAQTQTSSSGELSPPPPNIGIATPEAAVGQDPLRVVLASLDQNVDAFAREAAHEKLAQKHEGPFWKRIAKSVWQNLTREYQVVKATQEAREAIHENENLLHHHGKSDAKWREAVVNRYGSEYAENLMHDGESFKVLNAAEAAKDAERPDAEKTGAGRIFDDIQALMRKVGRGEVADDSSLEMMEERMAEAWREKGIGKEFIGEGRHLAKNIGAKARQLEAMINSAEGLSDIEREALLEQHLAKLEIATGEARVGSRTEIDSRLSERISEGSERLKEKLRITPVVPESAMSGVVSALGNETVIAAMVSGGAFAAKRAMTSAGRVIAPGIAAGVIAGIRERRALKDERQLMQRRADADLEHDPTNKAQAELMEKGMYETRAASELITELGDLYNEHGELKVANREELDKAIELQAQIRARIQISDRTGARLIGFDNMEGMEAQRFDLDLAMAKLTTDMNKLFNNPVAQGMLDIEVKPDETPEQAFTKAFEAQKSIAIGMLEGEMKTQDRVFNKLVTKRVLKRALSTMFMGAAIGYAAKETADFVEHTYDSVKDWASELLQEVEALPEFELAGYQANGDLPGGVGVDEQLPTGVGAEELPKGVGVNELPKGVGADSRPVGVGANDTSGLPKGIGVDDVPSGVGVGENGLPTSVGVDSSGDVLPGSVGAPEATDFGEAEPLSDLSKITLPEGFKTEVDGDTVTITTPEGKQVTGLTLEKDGQFSQESLEKLRDNGYTISHNQGEIPGKPEVTKTEVSPKEFVQRNSDKMKKIHITKWFDNDSSRYDLNELGLQNRMDSSGNIVISIKGMTAGGSFHGNSGVNWEEAAKDGHMKIYLSASEGTQAQAFEVQIKPDGTAVIEKGSDARALFDEKGKFIGGFQQAALNGGKGPDGAENIAVLATVVGEKSPTLTSTTETPTWDTVHHYSIFQAQPAAASTPIPPPDNVIPLPTFTTRRNLGEAKRPPAPEPTTPELPVAPVIPIRPELAPAPEPARSQEAEQRAQTMGLGSSETNSTRTNPTEATTGTNPNANADTTTTTPNPNATTRPNPNTNTADTGQTPEGGSGADVDEEAERLRAEQEERDRQDALLTDNERAFMKTIRTTTENQPIPPELKGVNLSGLTPDQQKIAIALMRAAIDNTPRGTTENSFGYDRRVKLRITLAAQEAQRRLISTASPSMVRLMSPALRTVMNMPTPSGQSGGQNRAAA